MKKLIPLYLAFAACFFVGCGSSLETDIEFKGKVYYGYDAGQSQIGLLGPSANSRVIAVGYPEYATTDSQGRYTLTVKSTRKYNNILGDQYILEASGTSSPSVYPQGNYVSQQITVYGKPGNTVQVRDFVIYEHKKDDTTTSASIKH